MDDSLPGSSIHGNLSIKNIGVGCHFLLQGIFPAQGSNPHWWDLSGLRLSVCGACFLCWLAFSATGPLVSQRALIWGFENSATFRSTVIILLQEQFCSCIRHPTSGYLWQLKPDLVLNKTNKRIFFLRHWEQKQAHVSKILSHELYYLLLIMRKMTFKNQLPGLCFAPFLLTNWIQHSLLKTNSSKSLLLLKRKK